MYQQIKKNRDESTYAPGLLQSEIDIPYFPSKALLSSACLLRTSSLISARLVFLAAFRASDAILSSLDGPLAMRSCFLMSHRTRSRTAVVAPSSARRIITVKLGIFTLLTSAGSFWSTSINDTRYSTLDLSVVALNSADQFEELQKHKFQKLDEKIEEIDWLSRHNWFHVFCLASQHSRHACSHSVAR